MSSLIDRAYDLIGSEEEEGPEQTNSSVLVLSIGTLTHAPSEDVYPFDESLLVEFIRIVRAFLGL